MAKEAGLSQAQLLSVLKRYKNNGLMRRFAAVLNHRKIGLRSNVLVAWKVKKRNIKKVAKILVALPAVTHCYLRESSPSWPYNLYTMIHSSGRSRCLDLVRSISRKVQVRDFRMMFTLREYKKSSANLREVLR